MLKSFFSLRAAAAAAALVAVSSLAYAKKGSFKDAFTDGKDKFPEIAWTRVFPENVKGVAMAADAGKVVVCTDSKTYCLTDNVEPDWTLSEGWKHAQDLGISADGSLVYFQTDDKPKKNTEAMTLTSRLLDGSGNQIWAKPNPGRYQSGTLSPKGKYVLTGEVMHPLVRLYDAELNFIWEKPIQYWYVTFDPTESYIFDGIGGILYTTDGNMVWEYGPNTRILSVSNQAQMVMTQYYRTVKQGQTMFLMSRTALKKIEFKGQGGCVSPDGSLAAVVDENEKLGVYQSSELMASGLASAKPVFSTAFQKPWVIAISADNGKLIAMGRENSSKSAMLLADLKSGEVLWTKPVDSRLRNIYPTSDLKYVAVQTNDDTVVKYICY